MNICGVLVRVAGGREATTSAALNAIDGVEVHQTADGGRIVITIEDTPSTPAVETLRTVNAVKGVISASLVFHSFETGDGRMEPVCQGESLQ